MDVNQVTGAGGCDFVFDDSSGKAVVVGFEPYALGGYDVFVAQNGTSAMDITGLHTYRLTVLGSNLNLYVDNNPTPVVNGSFIYPSNGIGNLYWGDVSGGNFSSFDLESISWTNQGAFAPLPPSLTWDDAGGTGSPDGRTWDTVQQNWNNGSGPTVYTDSTNVAFNDDNNGNYAVTLNSVVIPGSVTVNNSSGNYVISGTGSIAGSGGLSKSGSDALTLSNTGTNTYSGGTTVSAGTLLIGAAGRFRPPAM